MTALSDILAVVEIDHAANFFVSDIVLRRFNIAQVGGGRHFVAFYKASPGVLWPVGYVNQSPWEQCYLCNALSTDNVLVRQIPDEHRSIIFDEGGGVAEQLLRHSFAKVMPGSKAIWGYVGNPRAEEVDKRVGLRRIDHPYLMVAWNDDVVREEEKVELISRAIQLGAF